MSKLGDIKEITTTEYISPLKVSCEDGKTFLYFLCGPEEEVFYIGITSKLQARVHTHRKNKPGWERVFYRAINNDHAHIIEAGMIRKYKPILNRKYNGTWYYDHKRRCWTKMPPHLYRITWRDLIL